MKKTSVKTGRINLGLAIIVGIFVIGIFVWWLLPKDDWSERGPIEKGFSFVEKQLMNPKQLIESYPYGVEELGFRTDYMPESLSESIGMWMWILELTDQKKKFQKMTQLLKDYYLLPNGTLSWRLDFYKHLLHKQPHSATIDDLRIILALLEAAEKWQVPEYRTFALSLAENMKKLAVYQNFLLHQTLLKGEKKGPFVIDVSYLSLKTMALLIPYDAEWQPIYDKSLEVLQKGMRPNGFIHDKYNIGEDLYYDADKNMINYILCAIYLAEEGFSVEPFFDFLKREWEHYGKIYGAYNPDTAQRVADYEALAVYGLAMRLAIVLKDYDFARAIEGRILHLTSQQKYEKWKGSLCNDKCHAFDHLQALLSLVMMSEEYDSKIS